MDQIDWNKRFDNIRLAELEFEEKELDDVISELNVSDEEAILIKDIITHLETTAADEIKNDKCVQLPYIGSIRKNPLRKTLDENRTAFKVSAKILGKEKFKEHAASVFKAKQDELRLEDYKKAKLREVKNKNKTKYEQYFLQLGPAYANMYLNAILLMRMVEYDDEFEQHIQMLSNG